MAERNWSSREHVSSRDQADHECDDGPEVRIGDPIAQVVEICAKEAHDSAPKAQRERQADSSGHGHVPGLGGAVEARERESPEPAGGDEQEFRA